jgi:trk system potassium uptake protein TrkH
MTSVLILFSFVSFLAIEWSRSLKMFSFKEKIFSSLFQVVTPRTAGFNTMDLNSLSFAAVFLLIMLMFIGASPGSTGGGVKTSTVGVIFAFLKSKIAARDSVKLYRRTLPVQSITKAFTIVTLAVGIICLAAFILLITHPWASMKDVLFEAFSAFSTVGLSLGMTPKLSSLGKVVIILTMYIGRIGPLTLLYAFSRQKAYGDYEYVEENVMIG